MSTFDPPQGYSSLSPYLIVDDPDALRDFILTVFPAASLKAHYRKPGGETHSIEIAFGDCLMMIGGSQPGFGPFQTMQHVYVSDVDAAYQRALDLGAQPVMPPGKQFYGDYAAGVLGPHNNFWWMARNLELLDEAAVNQRLAERESGRD